MGKKIAKADNCPRNGLLTWPIQQTVSVGSRQKFQTPSGKSVDLEITQTPSGQFTKAQTLSVQSRKAGGFFQKMVLRGRCSVFNKQQSRISSQQEILQ